ncbi:hypothetical protein FQR65_LT04080, partial [Abscondita terminalis]
LRISSNSATHELFAKEHVVRNHTPDKPPERTLFVLNVPPYLTEKSLKQAFSSAGAVENVVFQTKPSPKDCKDVGGFKVAYVVFEQLGSLSKSLKLKSLEVKSNTFVTGMKKWMSDYNNQICDQAELEKEIFNRVSKFDKEMEKQKRQANMKDDGGWTTVTRKGKSRGLARKESIRNKIKKKISEQEKRKHLTDFYVFQKRESKMNHLVEMRKRYEEDKKKVAAMKQSRKFKPY